MVLTLYALVRFLLQHAQNLSMKPRNEGTLGHDQASCSLFFAERCSYYNVHTFMLLLLQSTLPPTLGFEFSLVLAHLVNRTIEFKMNANPPQFQLNVPVEDGPVPLQPYQPLSGEHPCTAKFDAFHNLKIGADWLPIEKGKYTKRDGLQLAYRYQQSLRRQRCLNIPWICSLKQNSIVSLFVDVVLGTAWTRGKQPW